MIIDQRWALNLVYATLDRRPESPIYKRIADNRGRFTLSNLREWCWQGEPLDADDQELILSFMATVGICFPISQRSSSEEALYISPTHLPDSMSLCAEFDSQHLDQFRETVESTQLHRGHWFAILRTICQQYGEEAIYTKDACWLRSSKHRWSPTDKPWSALLHFQLNDEKQGLGGKITINLAGEEVSERLPKLKDFVESFLPGHAGKASDAVDHNQLFHANAAGVKKVFFSYAWDPVGQAADYEEAVNAIEQALLPYKPSGLVLLRDKRSMKPGDYITEFVAHAGSQDVDLVLIFTSDKYWKSWWCMLELSSLLSSLQKSNKGIDTSVLVIAHPSGKKRTAGEAAPFVNHWNNLETVTIEDEEVPTNLPEQLYSQNWKRLRKRFVSILTDESIPITSDALAIRKEWSEEKSAEIVDWVKKKLGVVR